MIGIMYFWSVLSCTALIGCILIWFYNFNEKTELANFGARLASSGVFLILSIVFLVLANWAVEKIAEEPNSLIGRTVVSIVKMILSTLEALFL